MRVILLITVTMLAVGAVVGVVLLLAVARMQREITGPVGPRAPAAPAVASSSATRPVVAATGPSPQQAPPEPIVLSAADAELHGAVLRLGAGKDQELCYWTSQQAYVQWPVMCPRSMPFRVEIIASCPSWAGGDFAVQVGDQTLAGKTPDTGGWRNYRTLKVGTVTLAQQKTTLSIKPAAPLRGRMMNVRAVRLVPVAG